MIIDNTLPPLVIPKFTISYSGNDSDEHYIGATELGESINGASKLYTAVAHYCAFGIVPKGNYKKEFKCYAYVQKPGSYEWVAFVATAIQEYNLHSPIYQSAFSFLFSKIIDALKGIWTKKGETQRVVENFVELLKERAKTDADLNTLMANGLIKANDNLASLAGRMFDTMPELAEVSRGSGRALVAPVGGTCKALTQFKGTPLEVGIDEPEAEVIRGSGDLEVDEVQKFSCKITEVNRVTGYCILNIEGFEKPITGKISDPVLISPNNIYTRSLDNMTQFTVSAKPVKRDGVIQKLYISDAK